METQTLVKARERALEPVRRRVFYTKDLMPEYADARLANIGGQRREWFGLSMSDFFQTMEQAETLPLLAWATRRTQDPQLLGRALKQLEEMATWKPLNRPGWTLYSPGGDPPADFNDGNWLATGIGMRVITQTLDILGDEVPAPLRAKLEELMQGEIKSVRADFAARRPWYWNTPVSNQFVLPNTGVVLASLSLGRKAGDADYEFAVTNLQRALDVQGRDGAHYEGTHYAVFTTKEILYVALMMDKAGDSRLKNHPHLQRFGHWMTQLFQPGNHLVNFSDGSDRVMTLAPDPKAGPLEKLRLTQGQEMLDCLMLCALLGQTEAHNILKSQYPSLYASVWAVEVEPQFKTVGSSAAPTFAQFSSSPLVTWRSRWDNDADGVWVRGGSNSDTHDHADRGHVNYILHGREILIEAGSTDYGAGDFEQNFKSGAGHNVLQIGTGKSGAARKATQAPITVAQLNAQGGDVTVDATGAYDKALLQKWRRRVQWDEQELRVSDEVKLASTPQTLLFRWHLGEEGPVKIQSEEQGQRWRITWERGGLTLESDVPLRVTSLLMPHGITYTQRALHPCLVVETAIPTVSLLLSTRLNKTDFPMRP